VAVIHEAVLRPSKPEALAAWVPDQPWLGGADPSTLSTIGAYRFDDPDGEVGMETFLLRSADGRVLQVPLTYRGAPLAGAETSLVAALDHSVLGRRWVYDGCTDPVYASALATTILNGGRQADLELLTDRGSERRESTTTVSGTGSPGPGPVSVRDVASRTEGTVTVVTAGDLDLVVVRVVTTDDAPPSTPALLGSWPGLTAPALLALARAR
jgi:hypothetical protein